MQAPDPIEAALARLMPPALSQSFQAEIEGMIDELAGPDKVTGISWLSRSLIGGGIAAALGGLVAIFPIARQVPPQQASVTPGARFELVSESDRIESMTDEGWQEDPDGSAMRALRLSAVEENNVRDMESGMVVKISEPREEILLMPVSAF